MDVAGAIPALADLAGMIGDPHVRNRGTIGGSVANNDPAADYPAAVVGLGATVVTDRREISGDDFFVGLFETALAEGELITAVRFPRARQGCVYEVPKSGVAIRHRWGLCEPSGRRGSCRSYRGGALRF